MPTSRPLSLWALGEMSYLYRVYHLRRDGGIARSEIISAEDDNHALHLLDRIKNGHGIELWDRARFLGKAKPFEPQMVMGSAAQIDKP